LRLWSLHPRYLDPQGLVAVWREGLLAQAVLRGRTRGYTRHPQLRRFQAERAPVACMAEYLRAVREEAGRRGYRFTAALSRQRFPGEMTVTRGQLDYEWRHLRRKLAARSAGWLRGLGPVPRPKPHPLFRVVAGPVEAWENVR
jgi:pyrimidine dimer DNA glycosylase